MNRRHRLPIALTIAGSDSGGGAGIQADLKTFASLGVHGTSAITCLTAQNPREIRAVQVARPELVQAQLEAVFAELPPAAVKTGLLVNAAIVRVVADCFGAGRRPPLIVDPVLVATSGRRLLERAALRTLESDLLPRATLVTPNIPEAEVFLQRALKAEADLSQAARDLHARWGCAVLVKGGHLPRARTAVDVLWDGRREFTFAAPFLRGVSVHGSGCTYSAAIAAYFALGCELVPAVERAKRYVTEAIALSARIGRHRVMGTPDSTGLGRGGVS